ALAFGAIGIGLGVHLVTGGTGSADLRRAHLVANVLGLVGLVILATLPYFTATQVRSKVAPRATAARVRALVLASALAVAGAGARLVHLLTGILWWAGATAGLAATVAWDLDDGPVLRAMVVGGLAQILVASLAYLGPVLRGGGHESLGAGFALTRSWVGVAA